MILVDNASYHKSNEMLKFYRDYAVPIVFTGSYSYDAAPVELLFAAFKSKDINPRHLP